MGPSGFPCLELRAASRADHLFGVYTPYLSRLDPVPTLRARRIRRGENLVLTESLAAWHPAIFSRGYVKHDRAYCFYQLIKM
jgi:hypothetical protein